MKKVFVIAEIGINHNGDLSLAKKLIDMAIRCKCDAVKFQKRSIEIVYKEEELNSLRESPWRKTFREQKEGLEFSKNEYDEIDKYCKINKIEWFASAWDIESLKFLDTYNLKYNKVASAMLTHTNFLEEIATRGKYTFISTGMSNYEIIDKAVAIFKDKKCPFELMHSVSVYPCPEEILNLHLIKKIADRYNCKVGYSGHEPSLSPSIFAVALNAASIERHITLDRSMYGSDQAASIEESGLRELVSIVKKFPHIYGSAEKNFMEGEEKVAKKLRYWEK